MGIGDIRSREAVLRAIAEYDRMGQTAFLAKYGYGPRTKFVLVHEGRQYDPKAILGVAHGFAFPALGPLSRDDFSGGLQTNRQLERLGFTVRDMVSRRR